MAVIIFYCFFKLSLFALGVMQIMTSTHDTWLLVSECEKKALRPGRVIIVPIKRKLWGSLVCNLQLLYYIMPTQSYFTSLQSIFNEVFTLVLENLRMT